MSRAGAAVLGGLMGLGVAIAAGSVLGVVAAVRMEPESGHESAGKAMRIAVGISEGLNCTAAAAIVTIPLFALWRTRRQK